MIKSIPLNFFLCSLVLLLISCSNNSEPKTETAADDSESASINQRISKLHPLAANSTFYEVNMRQYTHEGTFTSFSRHVNRLSDMGVDALIFQPIHEISKERRVGKLGNYHAVKNFRSINPEYGNHEAFLQLVAMIQKEGMKVIIDWIPGHTGWDHPWIKSHPDWYVISEDGVMQPSLNSDWPDVARLNFMKSELQTAMIEEMKFWVDEYNIDGFRVIESSDAPLSFWEEVDRQLNSDGRLALIDFSKNNSSSAFSFQCSDELAVMIQATAKGTQKASDIKGSILNDLESIDKVCPVYYSTNSKMNSADGSSIQQLGSADKAMLILIHLLEGIPMISSGQEEPLGKGLKATDRDPINFVNYSYNDLLIALNQLRETNEAFINGEGETKFLESSDNVIAFERQNGDNKLVVLMNLSDQNETYKTKQDLKNFTDLLTNVKYNFSSGQILNMGPWNYSILYR